MSSNGLPPASQANRAERPPLSMRIRGQAIPDQKPGPNDPIDWRDTAFYNQSKRCVDIPFSSIDHPDKVSWADILKWKESQKRVKRESRGYYRNQGNRLLAQPNYASLYSFEEKAVPRAPNNKPTRDRGQRNSLFRNQGSSQDQSETYPPLLTGPQQAPNYNQVVTPHKSRPVVPDQNVISPTPSGTNGNRGNTRRWEQQPQTNRQAPSVKPQPQQQQRQPEESGENKNKEWRVICKARNKQIYNTGIGAMSFPNYKQFFECEKISLTHYYWGQLKATLREDLFDLIRPTAEMAGSLEALERHELDITLHDTPLDRKKNAELEEFLSAKEEVMKLFNINQQNSRNELYNKLEDENTELGQKYKQLMTVLEKNVSEKATKKDYYLAREAMKRGDEMIEMRTEIAKYCNVSDEIEDIRVARDCQLMIEKKKKVAMQWYLCGLRAVNEYIPFYDDENGQESPQTRLARDLSLKVDLLERRISVIYSQTVDKLVDEFYEVNNWMVSLWWEKIISKNLYVKIGRNRLYKLKWVRRAMLLYFDSSLNNFKLENLHSLAELRNKCFDYIFFISIVRVFNDIDKKFIRLELEILWEYIIQESTPRTELGQLEIAQTSVPFFVFEQPLQTMRDLLHFDKICMSTSFEKIQLVDGKLQARVELDIDIPCLVEPLVAFKYMNDTFCGMCHRIVGDVELGSQAACPYCRRMVYCHEVCLKTARDIGLHSRAICSNFVPERMSIAAQLVFQTLVWAADNGNVGQLINELLQHFAGERPFACNLAELKPSDYKDSKQWKKFALACLFGDSMAVDKPQDLNSTVKRLLIDAIELRIKLEKTFPQEDGSAGQHTHNKKAVEALLYRLLYTVSYRNPLALSTLIPNWWSCGCPKNYGYGLAPLGQAFSFCCAQSNKANVIRRFNIQTGMVEYKPTRNIAAGERLYIGGPSKANEPKNPGQGTSQGTSQDTNQGISNKEFKIELEQKAFANLFNAFEALCDCGNCGGAPQR